MLLTFPPVPHLSLSYYVIGHFSGKNRVKLGNFVIFSGNNLKSYVVNHWYFFHNYFWPRSSGLGLEVLASFNITVNSITASKGAFTQRTARQGIF